MHPAYLQASIEGISHRGKDTDILHRIGYCVKFVEAPSSYSQPRGLAREEATPVHRRHDGGIVCVHLGDGLG